MYYIACIVAGAMAWYQYSVPRPVTIEDARRATEDLVGIIQVRIWLITVSDKEASAFCARNDPLLYSIMLLWSAPLYIPACTYSAV